MQSNRKASIDYGLTGILAVVVALLYFIAQSWNQESLVVSTDLLFIAVSGGCSSLGLLVVRRWGYKGRFGLVHLGLFLAVFLWFLGEAT
jgi:hypothetical protein